MRIGSIYYGAKPVIAIYAGSKLIYSRGKVSLRSLPAFVTTDLEALLNLTNALAMEVDNDATELGLDIEAEPVTSPSMAMSAFELTEIKMDAYAELYVKDTSPFDIVEEHEITIESDMGVPASVAMSQETNLEVETVADGVASEAVPIERTIVSSVEVEADMNTPVTNPMALDSTIFESDIEASGNACSAAPIEGFIEPLVEIESDLTPAPVAQLEVDMIAASEVYIDAEMSVWSRPVQNGTNLHINAIYSATRNGTNLEVM